MESKLHEKNFVENYFANLNDISRKIALDISEIKATYEHIWEDLNSEEQMEIINETLIKPELTLKYFDNFSISSESFCNIIDGADENSDDRKINLYDGKTLQTFQYLKTGRKVIHEESIGLYRDEHSSPFSHKTKSQINLTIFPSEAEKQVHKNKDLSKKLEKANTQKTVDIRAVTMKPSNDEAYDTVDNMNDNVEPIRPNAFLTNIVCNQNGEPTLIATSIGSCDTDGLSLENIGFDDDKTNLFRNSSRSNSLHHAHSSSVEEDDKNFDELNSLLGKSKGFDFLNNW
ncbi:uncharacterized protein LOC129777579 [Toxorhynchites rutilus septentrionalis]|uniref:uncharacterized protein LOC129777579 n=1 Tax=Toxorhynchites rutilus septentrionalis TaxID=329112 RepID=UPI00247B008A|nr:uncharacterized protein LOC129777579 [Toxorhynchites rutilus septentrionalis]